MKNLNKALIATAVLAGLSSMSAFAGTKGCFEVYKTDTNPTAASVDANANLATPAGLGVIYGLSSCTAETARGSATANNLVSTDAGKIAYELTKNLDLELNNLDDDGGLTQNHLQIVYIPTTDIPSGTLIEMQLTGATFANNANQLQLVKATDASGDGTFDSFEAVASSDGTVDTTGNVKFVTKAGITIGAGTRLVLSQSATAIEPISVNLKNEECTNPDSSSQVTIKATKAVTDGGTGYSIEGAVSDDQLVLDVTPQFMTFQDHVKTTAEVNAESADYNGDAVVARTQFVYDATTAKTTIRANQVIYPAGFYNRGEVLDRAYRYDKDQTDEDARQTWAAGDEFVNKFTATSAPGETVAMQLFNTQASDGVLSNGVELDTGVTDGAIAVKLADATAYNLDPETIFDPVVADAESNGHTGDDVLAGALYNKMYYAVTNTEADGVMNFNYNVDVNYELDFADADILDHCVADKTTHEIGVNGAVLKVPYVVNGEGNFVRITNEHDEEAEVTVDVFGESVDGTAADREAVAVKLGTVPAKSSVVYFVPDLIAKAEADQGYKGADGGYATADLGTNAVSNANRHTMTFTVTAPRDTVHGVSVQRTLGGSDRVMPVLDLNDWQQ